MSLKPFLSTLALGLLALSPAHATGPVATPAPGTGPLHLVSAKVVQEGKVFVDTFVELQYQGEPGRHACVVFAMAVTTTNQTSIVVETNGHGAPLHGPYVCFDTSDEGSAMVRQGVSQASGVLLATLQLSLTTFHMDAINLAHPGEIAGRSDVQRIPGSF
jgi:hypothetical protein